MCQWTASAIAMILLIDNEILLEFYGVEGCMLMGK